MFAHDNVADGCETVREIYKAWGDRARQLAKRRQKLEGWGSSLLLASGAAFVVQFSDPSHRSEYITEINLVLFIAVVLGFSLLWTALQHWIEEVHIDYLLHKLDLEMAFVRIKAIELDKEAERQYQMTREPTEAELKRRQGIIRNLEDDLGSS